MYTLQIDGRSDGDGHSVSIQDGDVRRSMIRRSVVNGSVECRIVGCAFVIEFRSDFSDGIVRNQLPGQLRPQK